MVKMLNSFFSDLASPLNLLWFWNFGAMLGIGMVFQVASGFLLALYYSDVVNYAFYSVVYLSLEVQMGFMFRFIHSTGASLLFMLLYLHIGRALWYKSYKLTGPWLVGVLIFLLMMGVSFLGYVLPWGQMSFWAATVITNLLYVIPYIGGNFVEWVWGGFSVGGPTLSRFFILHYILPFVILGLSVIHLLLLHYTGSSNPLGVTSSFDKIEFHWFYTLKDGVFFVMIACLFVLVVLLLPYVFMDAENFLFVDSLKTPEHIKPEWYFLFAYCILRSVPNKVGGVVGLVMSIGVLALLPFVKGGLSKIQTYYDKFITVGLMIVFLMLTWLGGCLVEWPYDFIGKIMSVVYFILVFV